jgi:GH35 family endo-1,4-beta-xylanase
VIEFFIASVDPTGFGEGATYSFSATEGSGSDADATSSTYGPAAVNGVLQGTDTTNRFSFTLATPSGVSAGVSLTATATLAGSTSEFSAALVVAAAPHYTMAVTSSVVSDPVNCTTPGSSASCTPLGSQKRIPASVVEYTVSVSNNGGLGDPNAVLIYNDYSIESGFKHQSSLVLLKRLIADGAPITTVGIQGHWSLTGLTPERYQQIDDAIAHYKALKLNVAITELDVTLSGAGGGQLGGGGRGTPPPPPAAEQLQAQAVAYAKLFGIFVKHRDAVDRVTFWGLHDRRSWRSGQSPLAFDRDGKAKPALDAIVAAAPK